jgi:hypothetical protein
MADGIDCCLSAVPQDLSVTKLKVIEGNLIIELLQVRLSTGVWHCEIINWCVAL